MADYKRIELLIARFISCRYSDVVEIGVGKNPDAAYYIKEHGLNVRCNDIIPRELRYDIEYHNDDVFDPDLSLYKGADLIYSIRPGIEMVPAMIRIAEEIDCDLIVYHLGQEIYGDGGELINAGVILRRYHKGSKHENDKNKPEQG